MDLAELQQKIKDFELKAGFEATEFKELILMLKEELQILESANDDSTINHQLTDLLILLIQISNRHNTNFDVELNKWFDKSQKYLK